MKQKIILTVALFSTAVFIWMLSQSGSGQDLLTVTLKWLSAGTAVVALLVLLTAATFGRFVFNLGRILIFLMFMIQLFLSGIYLYRKYTDSRAGDETTNALRGIYKGKAH